MSKIPRLEMPSEDAPSEAAREVRDIITELERAQNEVYTVAQRAVDAAWRLAAGEPPSETQTTDWTGIPVVPIRISSEPEGAEVFIDDDPDDESASGSDADSSGKVMGRPLTATTTLRPG